MSATGFPDGFLWGAATSAHQVEGGNDRSDWWAWEHVPGHISDGTRSGAACEWWTGRAEEDLGRAKELGLTCIRLSVEWCRLETSPGSFDEAAYSRYEAILRRARSLGLTTIVGLNHFTLPRWLGANGWLERDVVERFGRYADRTARRLGDEVDYWVTLNEPSVLGLMGYAGTRWPPGLGRVSAMMGAIRTQLIAHGAAYHAVKDARSNARVGLVVNMPHLVPARKGNALDERVAAVQDWVFNGVVLDAIAHARFRAPLALRETPAPILRRTLDFLGLNYYGRYRVRFDPSNARELFGRRLADETVHTEHNDWGEIAPDGLRAQLVRLSKALPGVPLIVTENGIFDPTDARRADFIRGHVRAVRDAIESGADVRGYLVWSLIDNFEWAEGWSTPFGLFAIDRATQARTVRPSAAAYSRICRTNGRFDDGAGSR